MSGYSIEHIISECISDRNNLIVTTNSTKPAPGGAKNEIYWETWFAVNAWIESVLCKKKGAVIPMFGTFNWELKQDEEGSSYRPIFLLSDSFVKDHLVKRQRIHKQPMTAPTEEINFSRIAIKFTKALTKDMVFSGVRDIMKKIGDYVDRSYEFTIEFSFGTLKSKERKIKFEFNQARLAEILPENFFSAGPQSSNFAIRNNDRPSSTISTARSELNTARLPSTSRGMSSTSLSTFALAPLAETKPVIPQLRLDSSNNNIGSNTYVGTVGKKPFGHLSALEPQAEIETEEEEAADVFRLSLNPQSNATRPISPGLERILSAMEAEGASPTTVAERRIRAQQKVTEMAYLRTLEGFQHAAQENDYINYLQNEYKRDWIKNEKKKKQDNHQLVKEMQRTLDSQMSDHERLLHKERSDRVAAAAICIINPSEDNINHEAVNAKKKKFANDLLTQISRDQVKKHSSKQAAMEEEREYIDHLAMELDLQSAVERASHLEKQQRLLEAWERDGHIRNLKKLQSFGASTVKDYINKNMYDVPPSSGRSSAGMPVASSMSSFGIGYDPRKAKF